MSKPHIKLKKPRSPTRSLTQVALAVFVLLALLGWLIG
jgi:hypothetical protein